MWGREREMVNKFQRIYNIKDQTNNSVSLWGDREGIGIHS